MNWKAMLAVAMATLAVVGCDTRVDQTSRAPQADSVAAQGEIERIAGDKRLIVDVMKRALDKGTLDDAIELAMQDSLFANQVIATISADPRLSEGFQKKEVARTPAKASPVVSSRSSRGSSGTARSGDALDKAERTAQQANQKIDQAARIKQQATEAKRKIDEILRP